MDTYTIGPPPEARSAEGDHEVRVMVQHEDGLFGLLGVCLLSECHPTLVLGDHTYYRSRSTPRWVFYKRAVRGHGEFNGKVTIYDQPE